EVVGGQGVGDFELARVEGCPLTGSMRVLVAPDKFKGSLTAAEAARAMVRGVRRAWPGARVESVPLSDGGEGFLEAMASGLTGRMVRVEGVRNAVGRPGRARFFWEASKRTAYVALAEIAGKEGLAEGERDPWRTTTFGVGQVMVAAEEFGARRIVVGLGGSATNDGGTGLARALGYRFLDGDGRELEEGGGALSRLARVVPPKRFVLPEVVAAVDVVNGLCGPKGASRLFGPQKGATVEMARELDKALGRLATVWHPRLAKVPGAGAAGGTGFGLMAFAGARVCPGFEVVARVVGLERKVRGSDLVLTGEGALDGQTELGKGPERLREMAERAGVGVIAFAGRVASERFPAAFALAPGPSSVEEGMVRAGGWLELVVCRAVTVYRMGWERGR
ncbi:MAG: glycerate kinase, partial [Verrucomicrobiia bacterium]